MLISYEKIFVIGSNKTGTTSFHNLFLKQGLKSQHDLIWKLNDYQCFSDGIYDSSANNIYKNCHATFPNSLFILNTRPLSDWLYSRANHCCLLRTSKMKGWPPNYKTYLSWIEWRIEYYNDVLNFWNNHKVNHSNNKKSIYSLYSLAREDNPTKYKEFINKYHKCNNEFLEGVLNTV